MTECYQLSVMSDRPAYCCALPLWAYSPKMKQRCSFALNLRDLRTMHSPGKENRVDIAGGPGVGGDGNRRDQVGQEWKESTGRDNWNWGHFGVDGET